ncbi:PREDICTED: BRCA1-associated ATM activator 1 [Nanorana parkeri]|uniref:BRCA1-associated ATM activator 1 n=1 Tax=Nanorana parkeri TaxID=125878 RepID=UPI000854E17B|nr:PREDICTED: BRCA1-associated ATM activator 1 [Nanorana parkeri]
MDAECSQLLPHVCGILVDSRQLVKDDSIYEKLLDWFKSLLSVVPPERLLAENQCLVGLFQQVLNMEEPDPSLLAFSMRLVGMFAAQEGGFKYLQAYNVVRDTFGECSYNSVTWKDASVRRAWIQGLLCMIQHNEALTFVQQLRLIEEMLGLLSDSSLFVASAVNDLVAHVFVMSVTLEGQDSSRCISGLPDVGQTIFSHLEKLLTSGALQSVTQSLKALTAMFKGSQDLLADIVWSRMSELINSLLHHKPVLGSPHLEGLLLSVTRFPVFCTADYDLWVVVKHALKELSPLQAGSLSFGLLSLKQCPQDVRLQSLCVLLHPLDCILRASEDSFGQTGLLDKPVCDPVIAESLLSRKTSCTGLLCQCLSHITDLCDKDNFPAQIPHDSVLHSVMLVLKFCIGQSVCTSPAGSHFSRFLIGCLRVQRSALDAIAALSAWPLKRDSLEKTYKVLTAYLENPETDPTVLKKAYQASLKWLQTSQTSAEHREESHCFLQGLYPVLMKRLCSPHWEARDSTLEFITHLLIIIKEHGEFLQVLSSSGLLQLAVDLLKDPESYVRASAVTCMGRIANIAYINPTSASSSILPMEALNRENLVPTLMDILCQDTEGFPRRAVVKVFTDWLRTGHMTEVYDAELLVSRVLEVTLSDLDWEVKVNALDLAHDYLSQALEIKECQSCPYTADLPSSKRMLPIEDAMLKCEQVGLFQFLLSCLCDCDRPVALKACEILLSVKPSLCEGKGAASELHRGDWLEGTLKHLHSAAHAGKGNTELDTKWVTDVLKRIDLDGMKCTLSKSSDYLQETPLSLLQDIRATLCAGEEQDADCY